jgi:hypothetical protein
LNTCIAKIILKYLKYEKMSLMVQQGLLNIPQKFSREAKPYPKMAVPQMGYLAVCLGTENNAFGIWETDEKEE